MTKKRIAAQQSEYQQFLIYNHLTPDIIAQNPVLKKAVSNKSNALASFAKKTKKRKKSNKHLTIYSRVRTLALKFYPEQLMKPEVRAQLINPKTNRIPYDYWNDESQLSLAKQALNDRIKNFVNRFNSLKSPRDKHKRHWQLEAICHDKDYIANPDDMFLPAYVKPHFHLILRDANNNRFMVKTILDALHLHFTRDDSDLFYEQGCSTVHDFNAYSMYLTHETTQAISDGKELYDLSEVMTNMSLDELKSIRSGYSRLQAKSKLTEEDWNRLADFVAKLGDNMNDFEVWADKCLSFVQRTSKKFKDLQVLYNKHLLKAVEKSPDLIRCCILISGKQNDGKSFTTRHALQKMGEIVYNARSSTGKYDGLSSRATAMIFDDRKMTDSLNVTDNHATVLHSRGTGNDKLWLGRFVIITTNLKPDDFFRGQVMDASQLDAIKSRFYTTSLMYDRLGHGKLALIEASTRGTKEDIAKRNNLYKKFADTFNDVIKGYKPVSPDEAPKVAKTYYQPDPTDPTQSPIPTKNQDLLDEVALLRKQNRLLHAKFSYMIKVLRDTVPGAYGSIFYTGSISSAFSPEYPKLIEFLNEAFPYAKVYKEDSYKSTMTVAELLEKLPKPNSIPDEPLDDNFELAKCEYIRVC